MTHPISIDRVDVVTGIGCQELIGGALEACKGVRPGERGLLHQFHILVGIILDKFTGHNSQPVASVATRQTCERGLAWMSNDLFSALR